MSGINHMSEYESHSFHVSSLYGDLSRIIMWVFTNPWQCHVLEGIICPKLSSAVTHSKWNKFNSSTTGQNGRHFVDNVLIWCQKMNLTPSMSVVSEVICHGLSHESSLIPDSAMSWRGLSVQSSPQLWHIQSKISLTHLPVDKMAAISWTTFSNAFSWMKSFVFWIDFHWSLFLRVQLTIF